MLETLTAIGGVLGGLGQAAGGAAGLFGGGGNNNNFYNQLAIMREQAQLQREFAQNGIQWRVQDAKNAGIHPLYALGGSGASYSPSAVSVGGDSPSGLGRDLQDMGQGIGRAVAATASKEDRAGVAFTAASRAQALERGQLENDHLKLQILASQAALQRAQVGPPMPTGPAMQAGPGHIIKPAEITASASGQAGLEAGPHQPGNRNVAMTPSGKVVVPLPGKDFNFEEMSTPGTPTWQFWHTVAPWFSQALRDEMRPSASQLPPGTDYWEWTPMGYVARKYGPPPAPRTPGYERPFRRPRALPRIIGD